MEAVRTPISGALRAFTDVSQLKTLLAAFRGEQIGKVVPILA